MYLFVPSGPYLPVRSPFKISAVVDLFKIPQMRGAALGYFGHMWELYALWAYLPLLIQTYAAKHSLHTLNDSMGAFVVIGAGAVGCILGGELAKRIGSIRVAFGQLFVSGLLCIASPLLLSAPPGVFFALLVLWGVTAAGDSPQFSSLLGIGAPRQYVGTAFTVVNCVGFSISALSILVVGYLSNRFPPEFLFLALAPGPILGLIAGKGLVRAYANGKKPDTRRNLMSKKQPMILGIGGTLRSGSSSERALNIALTAAEKAGATVRSFTGAKLDLPHYDASNKAGIEAAAELLELYRQCDGVIISSPGYHGSTSGMIKNALDYIEELRSDERVYLEDRPVGCIVCAYGWQATGTTLTALRSIVHALRGWPTPLGVTINSAQTSFSDDGGCSDSRVADQLHALAGQVLGFASQGVAEPHSTAKST